MRKVLLLDFFVLSNFLELLFKKKNEKTFLKRQL